MHFKDILDSIKLIEQFTLNMTYESYQTDQKTKSAVERQLQIVTEAASRLGSNAELLCPGQDWKEWVGLGNVLRHAYHRVEDELVWTTLEDDLPNLKAVKRVLAGSLASAVANEHNEA